MHKTAAWPLALVYAALVVYASLYPFEGWRDQGIPFWAFLTAPLPRYWTGFDVVSNLVGYGPLGFLLTLGALRSGRGRGAVMLATLGAGLLSLAMESLQTYLPARVPSTVDFALNLAGGWLGAVSALLLERMGALASWARVRERWFTPDARGAIVLLALWPPALLFPAAVPLGLGQVYERLEASLAQALVGTPFLDWLPVRQIELQPLGPLAEALCVAMGLLLPCLLGFSVIRHPMRRLGLLVFIGAAAVGVTVLSAALSYGPAHAWGWLNLPARTGLTVGLIVALLAVLVPRRACLALLLLMLAVQLSLLNRAPPDPYFALTLQVWEQGRFIRFHGLGQWLGWLWPYAVLAHALVWLSRRERENTIRS
ncbi:MAG: VanZ family protein [Ramlibacter sp.]|jgi:VanZ family protein|nr:VanZ family protein [Ramlibacter sp.]